MINRFNGVFLFCQRLIFKKIKPKIEFPKNPEDRSRPPLPRGHSGPEPLEPALGPFRVGSPAQVGLAEGDHVGPLDVLLIVQPELPPHRGVVPRRVGLRGVHDVAHHPGLAQVPQEEPAEPAARVRALDQAGQVGQNGALQGPRVPFRPPAPSSLLSAFAGC